MGGDANVVVVPPLQERRWEVPGLAERVLQRLARRQPAPAGAATVSGSARRKLLLHGWPGNFRELEQCLVEAVSLTGAGGVVHPEALKIGTGESAPHARPLSRGTPPRPKAGRVGRLAPVHVAEALGLPDRLRWPDLFLLTHRLPDRAALTEALVAHRERHGLPGANARSVSKEIGRLVRCDRFPRSDCQRCFSCRLVTGGAPEVIAQLDRTARDAGLASDAVVPWIARGVERLVVDRLGRGADAWREPREALQAAGRSSAADLEGALAEVARMLGDAPGDAPPRAERDGHRKPPRPFRWWRVLTYH